MTDDDSAFLNGLQINRCIRDVFSDRYLLVHNDDNTPEKLRGILNKEKPKRYVTKEGKTGEWIRDFINIASPAFEAKGEQSANSECSQPGHS